MAPLASPERRTNPQLIAWGTLTGFTALFCVLVSIVAYTGTRFVTEATLPREARVIAPEQAVVLYQQRGRANPESIRTPCADGKGFCVERFREGDKILAYPDIGYGKIASMVFDDADVPSQVDVWAHPFGANLTLESYQVSRWNTLQQQIRIRQDSGYARYDLHGGAQYANTVYTVVISDDTIIELAPGGSYSINVMRDASNMIVPLRTAVPGAPLVLAEVAVRSGNATVVSGEQRVTVQADQLARVAEDGMVTSPGPAEWDLLADGDFTRYSSDEYNNPKGTSTWSINSSPGDRNMDIAELNGIFNVFTACTPEQVNNCNPCTPEQGNNCDPTLNTNEQQMQVAQFRRSGGQTRTFITAITQTLDVDISEFQTLELNAWVRVLNQSIPGTGSVGTECPIMIELTFKENSPGDPEQFYRHCVFQAETPEVAERAVRTREITYTAVAPYEWQRLRIPLRSEPQLLRARYLQRIRIEARGHDYTSEIAQIRLRGQQ